MPNVLLISCQQLGKHPLQFDSQGSLIFTDIGHMEYVGRYILLWYFTHFLQVDTFFFQFIDPNCADTR